MFLASLSIFFKIIALHGAHLLHAPILQSTAQLFVRHFRDFFSAGHFLPPYLAFVVTLRVVVCLPPPQVFEQDGKSVIDFYQLFGAC